MTSEELKTIVGKRLEKATLGKNTVLRYKGALSHIIKRIPIEAFGDEDVVRAYRQTISVRARSVLGVVWPKIYEELCIAGLPCVPPKELTYRAQLPIIPTDCIEVLAIGSSFVNVADASWGDVQVVNGVPHLLRIPINDAEKGALRRLADYYWPGQEPPPDAPLVALSPRRNMIPMPLEMVTDAVTVLEEGSASSKMEDQLAYRVYRAMCANQMPLTEVERCMQEVEGLVSLKRGERSRAHVTMTLATKALQSGNIEEFWRLWAIGIEGQRGTLQAPALPRPTTTWAAERKATIKSVNAKLMSGGQSGGGWSKVINLAKDGKTG